MANYCYNYVTISGDKETIKKIADKLSSYEQCNYFTQFGDYVLGKIENLLGFTIEGRDGYEYGTRWWEFEMDISPDGTLLTLSGDSAWAPPMELIRGISEVYKIYAELDYEEPGMDFAGTYHVEKGEVMLDEYLTYGEYKYRAGEDEFWSSCLIHRIYDEETLEEILECYPFIKDDDELIDEIKEEIANQKQTV